MKFDINFLAILVACENADALSTSKSRSNLSQMEQASTRLKRQKRTDVIYFEKKKKRCNQCPEPDLDLELSRQEAVFSMLGQLLASGALILSPEKVHSFYGTDANIEMPNFV